MSFVRWRARRRSPTPTGAAIAVRSAEGFVGAAPLRISTALQALGHVAILRVAGQRHAQCTGAPHTVVRTPHESVSKRSLQLAAPAPGPSQSWTATRHAGNGGAPILGRASTSVARQLGPFHCVPCPFATSWIVPGGSSTGRGAPL